MYVFNLCPFPVKGNGQLYSWISIPAMKNFPRDEVAFIGSPNQLADPATVGQADWVYELVGTLEVDPRWDEIRKITVPVELTRRVTDSHRDLKQLLMCMITEGFHEYREYLYERLRELHSERRIKAVVTFVNCRSLEQVCALLGIPVVHMEAGFLRVPTWKISTFQFDFRGVNGNSEAADRFELDKLREDRMPPSQIAELLLNDHARVAFSPSVESYSFEFGIPLQVDDDSNLIAFGAGLSNLDTIYIARQVFPPDLVLARNHPLGLMQLSNRPDVAQLDRSENSIEFVSRCKRILTINSSVAFESMLMGRATYVLGESPLGHVALKRVDRHVRGEVYSSKRISDYLDFIAFQYLIPQSLWMNKAYIDFRLAAPSETDIRAYHLKAINDTLAAQSSPQSHMDNPLR